MKLTNLTLFALSIAFAVGANAQCGPANKAKAAAALLNLTPRPATRPHASSGVTTTPGAITGLWDSIFTSGGQVVDEGIEQWHSDGTEILNDIPEPASGNVCLGVWMQSGSTYILTHPFWLYDQSNVNLIGRGMIQQQVSVDGTGNSYSGSVQIQYRDLSGNPIPGLPDATGEVSATRITPMAPPSSTPAPAIVVTTANGAVAAVNGVLQTPFSPFLLDASGSTGSGTLTYAWSSSQNSPVAMVATGNPAQTLLQFESAGDYVVNLKVTDAQGNSSTFSVTVEYTGRPQ